MRELGYANIFQIPPGLISLDLTVAFGWAIGISAILLFLYVITEIFYAVLPVTKKGNIAGRLNATIWAAAFTCALAFIYGFEHDDRWDWSIWLLGIFAADLIIQSFLLPLWTQRGVGAYIHKVSEADRKSERPTWGSGRLTGFAEAVGRQAFLSLIFLVLVSFLSFHMGQAEALRETYFYVVPDTNLVVLRIYGDKAVAGFHTGNRLQEGEFALLNLSEGGKSLKLVKLGGLGLRSQASTCRLEGRCGPR